MHLNKIIIFLFVCLMFATCNDANVKPNTSLGFIKTFGGTSQGTQNFVGRVEITSDGGYVLLGTSSAFNDPGQLYLIKTDKNGNKVWEKNYGGPGQDAGASLRQTSDGGFILLGTYAITVNGNSFSSMYVVKTNENGDTLWTNLYNETTRKEVVGTDVSISADGNFYYLAGYIQVNETRRDGFIRKINNSGNVAVVVPSNLTTNRYPFSIYESDDEGINWFGTGGLIGPGVDVNISTPIMVGFNKLGNGIFAYDKTAPDINENNTQNCVDAAKLSNGEGYIITGSSINNGGEHAYIMKLSSVDAPKYLTKAFYKELADNSFSVGNSVIATSDGGYAMTGSVQGGSGLKSWGKADVYLVKFDKDGNKLWEKTYGGSEDDTGISLKQARDGGYIIAAKIEQVSQPEKVPVMTLIKVDENGNIKN
jgi:hypothetical protein